MSQAEGKTHKKTGKAKKELAFKKGTKEGGYDANHKAKAGKAEVEETEQISPAVGRQEYGTNGAGNQNGENSDPWGDHDEMSKGLWKQ